MSPLLGHAVPVDPVPPEHVHIFGAHEPLMNVLEFWYVPAAHAVQEIPYLKYPDLHDAHLAVLCVGQELPVARVPPEHVQTFVEQTRLRVVVGDVDSY